MEDEHGNRRYGTYIYDSDASKETHIAGSSTRRLQDLSLGEFDPFADDMLDFRWEVISFEPPSDI